ncbi:type III secretion system translocon subunit SctE [Sodalis sp. RH15]|uniref:type III secretion system translocon subunit SctE n=1 Tax=Sodalis sp. RH15 TaxID=3394330 RepID=UPI0039B4C26B
MTDISKPLSSSQVHIFTTPAKGNEAVNTALYNKTHITQEKALSLFQESQKAALAMLAVMNDNAAQSTSRPLAESGAPELREPAKPVGADAKLSGSAVFTLLAGNAMMLLGNHSLVQLADRLQIIQANSEALQQANEALAQQFQQAVDSSAAALSAAEADSASLQTAQNSLAEKQENYDQAKNRLDLLSPEDPEYTAALSRFESAERELSDAARDVAQAQVKAGESYQAARESSLLLDDLFRKMQGTANIPSPMMKESAEQSLSTMARMLFLISTLMKLMGENNEKALANDQELFLNIQESEQRSLKIQGDKHAEEMKKAEALNTAMGCVGRILGGLITLISVVGAIFSGGASLAIAAVGIALMVGDEISKAVTGVSFMEKALSPIMDNIIKPLVDALSKGIAKMLERLGMDAATANMIGGIVGTLVAAALVIAVMIVGKAAAGKVASTAFANMVKEALKDILPVVLKNAATTVNSAVRSGVRRALDRLKMASDKEALQLYSNRLNTISAGTALGSETIQGGIGVARGFAEKNAADIEASFTLSSAVMAQIRQLIEQLIEKFADSQQDQQRLMAMLSDAQTNTGQTQKSILRNSIA